jgi:hypothetical protein
MELPRPICHWCHRETFAMGSVAARSDPGVTRTRDHVIPKRFVKGVIGIEGNLVPACRHCNEIRGDAPYEVFRFFVDRADKRQRHNWRNLFETFRFELQRAGLKAAMRAAKSAPSSVGSERPASNREVAGSSPAERATHMQSCHKSVWGAIANCTCGVEA